MGRMRVLSFSLISAGLCLLMVLAISGCYEPGGPVPQRPGAPAPRAWTNKQVDALVTMKDTSIYYPVPRTNGAPPSGVDYIHFFRYRLKKASNNASKADAILLLMPGILCGAGVFDYMGRQLVYMAKTQKNLNIEVWGTERRANRLEDLTGLEAAEAAHNTNIVADYYYRGATVNGKKFAGFLKDADVPYLSEFGLDQALKDVYKIMTTMVPSRSVRQRKIFVGGHSLGSPLADYFAGWDFDGNPATTNDAGYKNCAGFVALDPLVFAYGQTEEMVKNALPEELQSEAAAMSDEEYYATIVSNMRNGSVPRIFPMPFITPEVEMLLEPLGMEANWAPDAESTLFKRLPLSDTVKEMLKLCNSRTLEDYVVPEVGIQDLRYTNEAALGMMLDDNFMPISIIQSSFGFPNGGAMVVKNFPMPDSLAQIPFLQKLLMGWLAKDRLFIANDAGPSLGELGTGPIYGWTNYDECGTATDPDYKSTDGSMTFTTAADEVSDVQDVARMLYRGPTNMPEWYFTMRLMWDITFATRSFGPKYGLNFLYKDHVNDLPKIEFVSEKGPFADSSGSTTSAQQTTIRGYNHLDVLTAAANTPSRRPNEVFGSLIDFMIKNKSAAQRPAK